MTSLPITGHPDWLPGSERITATIPFEQAGNLAAGETLTIPVSPDDVGNVVAFALFAEPGVEIRVESIAPNPNPYPGSQRMLAIEDEGQHLWVPAQHLGLGFEVVLVNGGAVSAAYELEVVSYIGATITDLYQANVVGSFTLTALGAGETSSPFVLPQASLYNRVGIAVDATAGVDLDAVHVWVDNQPTPTRQDAAQRIVSDADALPQFPSVGVRASGLYLSVTNPGGDPVDVKLSYRLSNQSA